MCDMYGEACFNQKCLQMSSTWICHRIEKASVSEKDDVINLLGPEKNPTLFYFIEKGAAINSSS